MPTLTDLRSENLVYPLSNLAEVPPEYLTGTGFDILIAGIWNDPGLATDIRTSELRAGVAAAKDVAEMWLEAIFATGTANDGHISRGDIYAISEFINQNLYTDFVSAHGNDEMDVETGFHLVQGDGGEAIWNNHRLVDTVADGLFHVGFTIDRGAFTNEDGNRNLSLTTASDWINTLLA